MHPPFAQCPPWPLRPYLPPALHLAPVVGACLPIVEILLRNGVRAGQQNLGGATPLCYACGGVGGTMEERMEVRESWKGMTRQARACTPLYVP